MGQMFDVLAATTPAGRGASPDEIAATVAFLASDDASFVYGAILPADGGRVAGLALVLIITAGEAGPGAPRLLAGRSLPVRVLVRNPEKAAVLTVTGADVVIGDLDDHWTMEGVTGSEFVVAGCALHRDSPGSEGPNDRNAPARQRRR